MPSERPDPLKPGAEDAAPASQALKLGRSTELSAISVGPPRSERGASRLQAGDLLVGRFEVQDRLGSGGTGQVFSAFDRERQVAVALKVLGSLSSDAIAELKAEFRAASGLVHPNLVRLHELGSDGPTWFFTMDRVSGEALPEWQARVRPNYAELRHVFCELALGLDALHQASLLHRDLKPSNFLVTADGMRVVLLDFGLAQPIGVPSRGTPVGTPAYMAPEQLWGQVLSPAADWYAYGVVLYEALTGVLPRRWPSAQQLSAVPSDLAELCLRLLDTQPEVRPLVQQILDVMSVGGPAEVISSGPASRPRSVQSGVPVLPPPGETIWGRERELAKLHAALRSTVTGQGQQVLISGPSGIGKTALVEHFVKQAQRHAIVLRGCCRERESMSYKAVDGLIDDVIELLLEMPREAQERLLPRGMEELCILFPALRKVVPQRNMLATVSDSERAPVRWRAIEAWTGLMTNLQRTSPLVLWLDDLQWSDAESAALLNPILYGPTAVPLLFVGSFRSSIGGSGVSAEGGTGAQSDTRRPALLRALDDQSESLGQLGNTIVLAPLAEAAARQLVAQSLGVRGTAAREPIVSSIAADAQGHPLFLKELAHLRSQLAEPSRPASVESTELPSLNALLHARVRALDDASRHALSLLALGGMPLTRKAFRELLEFSPAQTEEVLDSLRAHRLIRSDGLGVDARVDCYHDRVRDAVVELLDPEHRRVLHAQLAHQLAHQKSVSRELLASHHQAAGQVKEALELWRLAAQEAMWSLAFAQAAELYGKAQRLLSADSDAYRELGLQRAQALIDSGQGRSAAHVYLELAALAKAQLTSEGSRAHWVEFQRQAGEQLLLAGHVVEGTRLLDDVAEELGVRRVGEGRRKLLAVALGRALVRVRNYRYSTQPKRLSHEEEVRLDVYWTVSCSLSLVDPIGGARYHNRHLMLALRTGEPLHLLRALVLEASFVATSSGSSKRSARLIRIIEAVALQVPGLLAEGLVHFVHGTVAYLGGNTSVALPHWERALSCFQRCPGATWETINLHRFMIGAWYQTGRFGQLAQHVDPLLANAEKTGNRYALACFRVSYGVIAWLTRDEVELAAEQLRNAKADCPQDRYHMSHYGWMLGQCLLHLYTSQAAEAYDLIKSQWRELERSSLLRIGVVQVQLWHLLAASAALRADCARPRGSSARRTALRRGATLAAVVVAAPSPKGAGLWNAGQCRACCLPGRSAVVRSAPVAGASAVRAPGYDLVRSRLWRSSWTQLW